MSHCENCGTRISDGCCPNCHEELFIFETQYEFLPDNLSDDFIDKVTEQAADCQQRFSKP